MFRKLFVIMLGIALLGGFTVAEASHVVLKLRVDTNGFATFDSGPAGPGGGFPFYVSGDICKEKTLGGPCTPIGVFHCWGWTTAAGPAVVSQEFDLWGKGKIQVQGVEDEGHRAITGGTRKFKKVRGEATAFDFSVADEFIVKFNLINVIE